MKRSLQILTFSDAEIAGGAEKVANDLFQAYRQLGHRSLLAVGRKTTADPDVLEIPNESSRNAWARRWRSWYRQSGRYSDQPDTTKSSKKDFPAIAEPVRTIERAMGLEDFCYPGASHLLRKITNQPDVVHCHNLHGAWLPEHGYFDLTILPWLSHRVPVFITLHDAWLLSGHCAHSFECQRWQSGCGECPDLKIYPSVRRDATAFNWRRKRRVYHRSRFYVATPCQWLMDKVQKSILGPAAVETRVISLGIDLSVFRPDEKNAVRESLGLPQDRRILLFAANGIRNNMWKDYETMRTAVAKLAERVEGTNLLFIALGEDAHAEQIDRAEVRFVPFQSDRHVVAQYFQAADVYVHASRIDTSPTAVLEALACGTPVVATGVGGIPEQIRDGVTGYIVPPGGAESMASSIERLLGNQEHCLRMGENAFKDARARFDLKDEAKAYLSWYQAVTEAKQGEPKNKATSIRNEQ